MPGHDVDGLVHLASDCLNTCPGRGAARNEVERCTADPGPRLVAEKEVTGVPGLRRIIPLRSMLRRARDTSGESIHATERFGITIGRRKAVCDAAVRACRSIIRA